MYGEYLYLYMATPYWSVHGYTLLVCIWLYLTGLYIWFHPTGLYMASSYWSEYGYTPYRSVYGYSTSLYMAILYWSEYGYSNGLYMAVLLACAWLL
jgi:hypothetical protein